MDTFPEFEKLSLMPPVTTVEDYAKMYLAGSGGDSRVGGFTTQEIESSRGYWFGMPVQGVTWGGLGRYQGAVLSPSLFQGKV